MGGIHLPVGPQAERLAAVRSGIACGKLCRFVASDSMPHSGLLNGEEPGPVVAVPQPAWADPNMHDVGIIGAPYAVRILGEVRPEGSDRGRRPSECRRSPPRCTVISLSQPLTSAT
jgi:hypothetical protein